MKNKKRIILGMLVLMWMILIFSFSHQTGEESKNSSNILVKQILNIPFFNNEELISFIIRKGAHFTIYFIGGILIYLYFNTYKIPKKNIIISTIIVGILFAISDELHQYFISERSAELRDVAIDSAGIVLGALVLSLIKRKSK